MNDINDLRSLDLCAIGLGQGGGNLAAEWRRRGYRALLLNTARADVRALSHHEGLDVPEKLVLDIGLEGSEGAGKDPEYGMACVRSHADDVRAAVEKHLRGADALLLCAGLGGGTGSALPELVRTLAPLDVPVITVTTLPSSAESGIAKVNAVKTVNALVGADLAGRVFIDNERLVGTFPELDMISYFPAVNARVLAPLDELNRLNRRGDLWSIRTFDGEDLRKVLLSGGVLQTHVAKLSADGALDVSYLSDVVSACVDGGDHLARGLDISKVAYLALVVVGPEKALRSTAMHVFDDAVRELKQRTGGGAVYEGLYVAPDDAPLKAYVLSASFSLPERVGTLLDDARAEGSELAKKIQAEIAPLELAPLEELSLFRATSRRGSSPRVKSPEPRPLGEQLAQQVQDLTRPRAQMPARDDGDGRRVAAFTSAASRSEASKSAASTPAASPSELMTSEPPASEQVTSAPAPEETSRSEPSDAYRPRVGSGRYDDGEELEATRVAKEEEAAAALARPPWSQRPSSSASAPGEAPAATGRVALADPASQVGPSVGNETEAMAAAPGLAPMPPPSTAPAPVSLKSMKKPTPVRPQTNRAALLPDDARVAYELPDEDAGAEHVAVGADDDAPMTDPEARVPFLHRPVSDDSSDDSRTRTDARPTWMNDAAAALSSINGGSGTELQSVYEDLVERFRQAPDKRDRERVGRRLVDDAQADDVEVRALAVWAMVKLGDVAFKRALLKCQSDGNPEIARMAREGAAKLA